MKTVFANSAWVAAPERLVLRSGRLVRLRLKVRFGLVIHPVHGPILIDTGYTHASVSAPGRSRILKAYSRVLRPQLNADQQPAAALARFGFEASDVRFLIVTHFHADHVSGLGLFPNAQFITNAGAYASVLKSSNFHNIRHGVFPELIPDRFADRIIDVQSQPQVHPNDLPKGYDLLADGSLVAVDLPGHAKGHFGVLIQSDRGPILYAVDAQWLRAALPNRTPRFPARLIADDFSALKGSSDALARFQNAGGEMLFCHDPETNRFDL